MHISPIVAADQAAWHMLWMAYLESYETVLPEVVFAATFARLTNSQEPLRGFAVRANPESPLEGIAHYFFHPHAWTVNEACYLQDLFVAEKARGLGYGRALIEAVADAARDRKCEKFSWLTKSSNVIARSLYDKIAENYGFIRYDYLL